MEVNKSIWTIIRSLHRMATIQRRASANSELGPVPLGVLNLASQGAVRPREAAVELDVPAQSITRAVEELAASGLVRRADDPLDGRSYAIELTPAGRRRRQTFQQQLTREFAVHVADWSTEELATFARQLERLVDSVAARTPSPSPRSTGRNRWRSEG